MRITKKFVFQIILIIIVGWLLSRLSVFFPNTEAIARQAKFDAANRNSRIRKIHTEYHDHTLFAFENDTNEYYANLYIYQDMEPPKHSFNYIAQIGDSVSKETNALTLFLFKENKVYKYRVK